jgi:hypothetical protein
MLVEGKVNVLLNLSGIHQPDTQKVPVNQPKTPDVPATTW